MIYSASSAPRNPQVIAIDKTTLQLQWMEPEILNGIIIHYRVSITVPSFEVTCKVMNTLDVRTFIKF